MNNKRRYWFWLFSWAVLLLSQPALAEDHCEAKSVVFGFFNGVKTTLVQANAARRKIEDLYGPTSPKGEAITYELFYNDSEGFSDFVETFEQRLQEHNGLLAGRYASLVNILKTVMERFA